MNQLTDTAYVAWAFPGSHIETEFFSSDEEAITKAAEVRISGGTIVTLCRIKYKRDGFQITSLRA